MLIHLKRSLWSWLSRFLMLSISGVLVSDAAAQPGVSIYTIPVVFHVLHENGNENIADAQLVNGLEILNEHFDAPTGTIDPPFDAVAGDMDIAFVLATSAPDGSPTTGIERIETPLTNNAGAPETYLNTWPRNRYLNIWVVRSLAAFGAACVTRYPAQADAEPCTDGIMVYHSYVGTIGTASLGGRHFLARAVAQFLDLKLLYEDPIDGGPCGDDDVADTPPCTEFTCISGPNPCSDLPVNEWNYMYSPYASNMFTLGQRERVHACLASPIAQRNELASGIAGNDPSCFTAIAALEKAPPDVRFAPMPFTTETAVSGLPNGSYLVELRDLTGRVVHQARTAGNGTLSFASELPAGPYSLLLQSDHVRVARTVIKQ